MAVTRAIVHRLRLPMRGTYEIAGSATSELESILVVLEGADGTRGIGTADPVPGHPIPQTADEIYTGLTDVLLPAVVNRLPDSPNDLLSAFEDVAGHENAKSAVEMAYLDHYARRRGVSLVELFGGALATTEPLNAWVGIDAPDAMAEAARRWCDRGFDSLKMKISGDPDRDVDRVRAVTEAVGDRMSIRVDANEAYTDPETAIEVAHRLEAFDVAHLEQPVPREDLDGLRRVHAATSLVVMADEPILSPADAHRVLRAEAADRLKFKVLKSGGTIPVRRGLDVAAAAGVACVVGHGFCAAPAASAELQLVASHRNVVRPAETVGPLKIRDDPFAGGVAIRDGVAELPDAPGIGVVLEDGRLDEFATASSTITR